MFRSIAMLLVASCSGGADPCVDAEDCRSGHRCDEGACEPCPPPEPPSLTLLFVIDDSASMAEEQASLAAQMPRLLEGIAAGRAREPVSDIHVGVISTDMGSGPGGACVSDLGDDATLHTRGGPGCATSYPAWLDFAADELHSAVAADAACVIGGVGTDGCRFEQPLEATLKALSPGSSGVRFAGDTQGHADGAHAGFLRPEALLVVVLLTDADDCSASDPSLFDAESRRYPSNLNLRCPSHPDALHPLGRYVHGLNALDVRATVWVPIIGVPPELVPESGGSIASQLEVLLEDERMQTRVNPDDPSELRPSCELPGRGAAHPPRRLVTLTAELERSGAVVAVGSICQASLAEPVDRLLDAIERVMPLEPAAPACP